MTLREVFFSLGYKVDKNSEKKADSSIKSLKSTATKLLGAIGIGFSISGLAKLAQAAADMEATASQFKQVFDGMETEASNALDKIASDTGVATNRMKGSFTQIAAFAKTTGMETGDALALTERAMTAVADSAAFYDRTLEDTTESLRSFLKGNFENDAALGLSCTETTRNAAANKLYGRSFKDLSEQQKQLTLLKMVEDANAASGALGQAARESDTWTNQLGNMKQSLQDLKAAAGKTFLKPAIGVLKVISELLQKATKKVNEMSGTIEQKTNVITRKLKEVWGFLKKVGDKVNDVAKMFGGWQKILRVLAIAAGIVGSVFAFKKIASGIKMISKVLNPMSLKIMAIVAVVLILAAIIDDFINFMQGNDSVIGEVFKKAGIDADKVRQTILGAWNKIKQGLVVAWNFIKSVGQTVFNGLKQFWAKHGEQILATLSNAWNTLVTVAKALFNVLLAVVKTIFSALKAFWDAWGSTIIQFFTDVWNTLKSLIQPFLDALNGLLNFITGVFSGNWSAAWEGIKQMFQGFADFVTNIISGLVNIFTNLFGNIFGPALDKIKIGFENVKAFFTGLPDMAKEWMHDFIQGLVDGIKEKINDVADGVKEVGEKIKSFLHFSVPDEGPLTDYETWMPDFMQGLAKGIKEKLPVIKDAVKTAAEALTNMGNVSVNGTTANNAVGGSTTVNNVNQTNEYNINVKGDDPQTVNKAANTLKDAGSSNSDALANALAYGL